MLFMRIFNETTLTRYCETQKSKPHYEALKNQVRMWNRKTRAAEWRNMSDIKAQYVTASIITADRVVFNLVGNHYRLIVRVDFEWGVVRVCFIGTHKEYDKVEAETVRYDD